MAFRPGGMSDSEDEYDDYFDYEFGSSKNSQTKAGPASLPLANKKSPEQVRLEYLYNEVLQTILNDGDLEIIEKIFKDGHINANTVLNEGNNWTFLHHAVKQGNPKMIRFLLKHGANPKQKAKDDHFPFMSIFQAAKHLQHKVVKECLDLLREGGANLTVCFSSINSVMFAAKDNLPDLVEYFLDIGIDVNEQDMDGQTALHFASAQGYGKVVRVLLMRSADPKIIDENGQTPYELAATNNYFEISEVLYRVTSTKWRPGCDPALLKELVDPNAESDQKKESEKLIIAQKEHIEMTLEKLGLEHLIPVFKNHKINFLTFLRLTDEQLQSMDVQEVGVRVKILDSIRTLHNAKWNPASVNSLFLKGNITSPEVVCMLNDIRGHVQFMAESMFYLADRLKKEPKALKQGAEFAKPIHLKEYTNATIEATEQLRTEALILKEFFVAAENDVGYLVGDVVKPKRKLLKTLLWTACCAALLIPSTIFIINKKK